jgi:hypothetical protein
MMKKMLLVFLAFILLYSNSVIARSIPARTDQSPTEIRPLLIAQGFAFENEEFKVLKIAITGETKAAKARIIKKGKEKFVNIKGFAEIGGFRFELKLVSRDDNALEADLLEPSLQTSGAVETIGQGKEAGTEKKLDVPVGHLSLKLLRPDPRNRVFIGSLRVTSEKAEYANGTYEVYLNDNTPIFAQKNINKPTTKNR